MIDENKENFMSTQGTKIGFWVWQPSHLTKASHIYLSFPVFLTNATNKSQ